jgi:hypothetical protein
MLSSRTPEKKKMPKIITEWKDRVAEDEKGRERYIESD